MHPVAHPEHIENLLRLLGRHVLQADTQAAPDACALLHRCSRRRYRLCNIPRLRDTYRRERLERVRALSQRRQEGVVVALQLDLVQLRARG